jgi:hypothetical protein
VLLVRGWEEDMEALVQLIKQEIDISRLHGISIGGFRMPVMYYKRICKMRPGSVLEKLPLAEKDGIMAYMPEAEKEFRAFSRCFHI